jgi:hypothetical protein
LRRPAPADDSNRLRRLAARSSQSQAASVPAFEDNLDEMLRPHISAIEDDEYAISWALGWRLARTKSAELFGHGGDNPASMSGRRFCGPEDRFSS